MYWPFKATTPSQSEIFSVIVACSYVLSFKDQTPSQSEIFFVIVDCLYVLGFKDQTPSQSEIFSVIVACTYVLTFQGHNTLPKWNILCYCSLFICIGISWPNTLPKWIIFFKAVIGGTIFSKIFFQICYCTLIFARMYVLAFQHQYTLPKWNIFSNIFCYCSYWVSNIFWNIFLNLLF